ncbi:hypothetical protein BH24DEI2_BH24DEI2_14130 [soil metagenome]
MEKQLQQTSSEVSVPRRFSAKYKLEILTEVEAASEKGQVGQILRREGLYSSLLSQWRKQRDRGALEAMNAKKRGPKTNQVAAENRRLREQNARLEERLSTAEALIEAQGNAFALLQMMSRKSVGAK